jgi:hypothetical protein
MTAAGDLREAACLSEGICPDHLVPFTEYGQMFDWSPHRYRCGECGPDVIWDAALTFSGSHRRERPEAGRLGWKPVSPRSA